MRRVGCSLYVFIGFVLLAHAQEPEKPAQVAPTQVAMEDLEGPLSLENSINLRDPFSRIQIAINESPGPNEAVDTGHPLEKYELNQYVLLGIISGTKKNKALIRDPDGKMHIISEKTVLGKRKGLVKKIQKSGIIIEETVINLLNQKETVETAISFNKSEGG
jgi:Tfp pilus assembly protein PilP